MKCMEYLEEESYRDEENSIEKMSEKQKIRNSMGNYEKISRQKEIVRKKKNGQAKKLFQFLYES